MSLYRYEVTFHGPFLPGELTGFGQTLEAESRPEALAKAQARAELTTQNTGRRCSLSLLELLPN